MQAPRFLFKHRNTTPVTVLKGRPQGSLPPGDATPTPIPSPPGLP